ncbi:metallophosphoesterase family protein [Sporolactobacillus nakayamae]|uniref:DNA repair exonuclease SbcCD nuclease subunit n=1 Tax=Sporolactobacillus nakayamae TaxID=269670 RepID=A0A1I2VQA5_9BACL|nr:DNA repair exonuclease [Sporolactobacillus nakayamae]SFG91223.1 DNA repair exonuclease SbcCD nuclease subunit [Sporolactobacillus nakayamae]
MIRFIHTADLHLDRPFDGLTHLPEPLQRRSADSTFAALTRLVTITLHEQPDFMIIAGDIFDNSHRSIRAQRAFVREMRRLHDASIPVFLVYGNHDFLNKEWNHLRLPDNVHVFPEKPSVTSLTCADGQVVNLYGFSYHRRWIKQDMISQYLRSGKADYHIAILHGEQRSGSDESNYAPFSIGELEAQNFDYWALGHIHKRQQLSSPVPIWYPGDLQGLSFKESELGQKGASLVELDHSGAHVRFLSTEAIEWTRAELDFSGMATADHIEEAINAFKEGVREKHKCAFIRLYFSFINPGMPHLDVENLVRELIETSNEDEDEPNDFIWLVPGTCTFRQHWDKNQIVNSPHFLGDLFRLIEQEGSVLKAVEPLYSHHSGRKYLEPLSAKDRDQIRNESEQLLVEALMAEETSANEDD